MAKANEARRLAMAQREVVRKKVEAGLPISEEERKALGRKLGRISNADLERQTLAAAAKLMIKPQSVTELRLLVETTAAKHHYNPIEKLIELTNSNDLEEKDKVAIHKALLPFLVPQLAAPKSTDQGSQDHGIKVVITSFSFDSKKPEKALHTEKPVTVDTAQT